MIRYLDNNDNRRTSPNQNFGRELLELSCSASATTPNATSRRRLRRGPVTPTTGRPSRTCGERTGTTPTPSSSSVARSTPTRAPRHGAARVGSDRHRARQRNRAGRSQRRRGQSRAVAAEFISKKLWTFFAGSTPSQPVIAALRDVAIANDFMIKPWVRALLLRPEFYEPATRRVSCVRRSTSCRRAGRFRVAVGGRHRRSGRWKAWASARCTRRTSAAGGTTATSSTPAPWPPAPTPAQIVLLEPDRHVLGSGPAADHAAGRHAHPSPDRRQPGQRLDPPANSSTPSCPTCGSTPVAARLAMPCTPSPTGINRWERINRVAG